MQLKAPLCLFITLFSIFSVHGESGQLKQSLETAEKTQRMGQQSQQVVNTLAKQQQELLDKYQKLLRKTEYQKEYNQELRILEIEQKENIEILQQKIEDVKLTKQQLLPLLREMVKTLDQFILLDLPFHKEARLNSINEIKGFLSRSNVSISEKFRRVMAFYQAENDYNYNLEVYRDNIEISDESRSVQVLRVGRNALYLQTLDGKLSALWNKHTKQWQILDDKYQRPIRKAMRIASQKSAPDLITLPYLTLLDQATQNELQGAK